MDIVCDSSEGIVEVTRPDVADCTILITGQDLPLQHNWDSPHRSGRWLQIGAQLAGESQLIKPPFLGDEDVGGRRCFVLEVLDEPTQMQLLRHAVHGSGDLGLAAAHTVAVLVVGPPTSWHSLPSPEDLPSVPRFAQAVENLRAGAEKEVLERGCTCAAWKLKRTVIVLRAMLMQMLVARLMLLMINFTSWVPYNASNDRVM